MKFSFLTVFLLILSFHGLAQTKPGGTCKIKGRVIDSATRQHIDYATVTIFPKGSPTVAGGMITDEAGHFTIDNLATGEYIAKIDFIGYNSKTQTNIVLSDGHPTANLGDVMISSGSKNLKEVTVTGSRNYMENHLDKFVYNVEKDVTSTGGVATDVLRKVPQVSVDVNGNVELLGNGNIRVFINGKPSSMFDNNLADALQSIPANQIKSIEIITSPGAQYDAQGTGGIINIILKDNKSQGVNGNISLTGSTRLENATGNIHIKKGKLDIGLSVLGNWTLKGTTLGSLNRTTDSVQMNQNTRGTFERFGALPQLNVEYEIDKTSSISTSVTYNYLNLINTGTVDQDITYHTAPGIDSNISTVRGINSNALFQYADYNINYRKKFAREGQELNISGQLNDGTGITGYSRAERYAGLTTNSFGGTGHDHWHDREIYTNIDYAHPLAKDVIVNTGVKGTFSRVTDNSDHYNFDPANNIYLFDSSQLNNFTYNRDIYAAYVSVTFPFLKDYQLKLGIRDEETIMNMPHDTVFFHPSYNFFIPSVVISRKLNANQTLKLSYTRRLSRPGFRSLNPFVDATDPENVIRGNPALRPEKVENAELSYYKFFEKGSSILVTLYEKYQTDDNQTYIQYLATLPVGNSIYKNVAVITTINASIEQMAGINISGTLSLSKKFELRGSVILFNKYIISHFDSTTSNSYNYRINGNASYQFSTTLVAELFYSFNSPRTEIQGKFPSYSTYSFAIRKLLFGKKLSIAFTTTNPFNEYTDQATDIKGTNFAIKIDRKVPNRAFGISVNYKFGRMEYKEKKQERSEMGPDEN